MKMPSYVNPDALLSEEGIEQIIRTIPSTVSRGRIYAHLAVTNAVLGEMAVVADKEREHLATWLEEQGGIYTAVAEAIRSGETPVLDPPRPIVEVDHTAVEMLRQALESAEREITMLRQAPPSGSGTHPKPWAIRRKDGSMEYHDSRAAARRAANGDIVVDCR
jgi:hypothetical protein